MVTTEQKNSAFKQAFFRNVLVSGGYNYLAQLIIFLSSMIIARLLVPENYGVVGLITVFTGFISVFSDSGISLAVIKSDFGYSYHKSVDNLAVLIGGTLFFATFLLAYPIVWFYGRPEIFWPTVALGSTFIFKSMSIVRGALLSKHLDFGFLGKVVLINAVVTVLGTIILALLKFEHWAIIIPQIFASLVTLFLYERKLRFGFNIYPYKHLKTAFKYTRATIGGLLGFNFVNYWARNADNLLVGKFYGVSDLGIYNRAYSLLTLPLTLITGLMGTVLYPSLKRLKNEGGDIFSEYMFVLKIISFIVLPISFVFILFPVQLVNFLWGVNWIEVSSLLPYFGLLILTQALNSTTGHLLVLQGKEKEMMISGWIGGFFTISAISIGAMKSLIAIVQIYSLTFILVVLPFNIYYVFYKSLDFNLKRTVVFWLPIVVVSLIIWLACFYDNTSLKLGGLVLLFISSLIGARREIEELVLKRFMK